MVKLSSKEGTVFQVERKAADQSILLKNLLEDVGENDNAIPLPNVSADVLKQVLVYCEHYKNIAPTAPLLNETPYEDGKVKEAKNSNDINEWDLKYMKQFEGDRELLFQLILAANYLDIKGLLDLGCKTVANQVKGKSTEEMREIFGLTNDFTPDEWARLEKETEWAKDL